MDFTSTTVLNDVVDRFKDIGVSGMLALQGPAIQLCLALMIIDFVTDWAMYEGNVRLSKIINDVMKGSMFLAIIYAWPTIIGTVEDGFYQMGLLAGGGTGNRIVGPSDVLNQGFKICDDLITAFENSWDDASNKGAKAATDMAMKQSGVGSAVNNGSASTGTSTGTSTGNSLLDAIKGTPNSSGIDMNDNSEYNIKVPEAIKVAKTQVTTQLKAFNPVGILCYLIAILMVIFAHFWIALQLFLCQIEFYIFAALSTIFIPFGVFRHTKFLWDQTVRGVVSFGCKLMGTFFLIAVIANSMNFLQQGKTIPSGEQFSYYLRVGLVYLTIAFLVWRLPDKFASLLSGGGPSTSASEVTAGAGSVYRGARRTAGAVTGVAAAVAGVGLAGAAMKYQANRNKAKGNELDASIGATQAQLSDTKSKLAEKDANGNDKYTGAERLLLENRQAEAQSKLKGLDEEKKALGATTMKGMIGTKVGAKLMEGWVSRRENIRRDSEQLDSAFSDKRPPRNY